VTSSQISFVIVLLRVVPLRLQQISESEFTGGARQYRAVTRLPCQRVGS